MDGTFLVLVVSIGLEENFLSSSLVWFDNVYKILSEIFNTTFLIQEVSLWPLLCDHDRVTQIVKDQTLTGQSSTCSRTWRKKAP